MSIQRLLIHEAVGEIRALALDGAGRAVSLFQDRWAERETRLRWGQVLAGNIRKLSPADGGAFIALEGGQEGFLGRRDLTGLVEGEAGCWRIVAEARADKLAKLAKAETKETSAHSPLEHWQASLPNAAGLLLERSPQATLMVSDAFEDAVNPIASLAGGGRLQITPTPALVAVDVDTLGRQDKGRASVRAHRVGLVAAEELARQAVLRGLGGPLVLDCIAPLARRDGPDLKKRFLETFRALSTRRAECLAPSPFGLMEIVLEWRARPLHEAYIGVSGHEIPLATLLEGFRRVEREAKANPSARLLLGLPRRAFAAFVSHRKMYEIGLIDRFGARIEVAQTPREKIEVSCL